jgi:hypothetical protein
MKLFGKTLFEKSRTIRLYDFAQHGLLRLDNGYGNEYIQLVTSDSELAAKKKEDKKKKANPVPEPTPKELYALGTLNVPKMDINIDPRYIAEQQAILDGKLELLPEPPKKKNRHGEPVPIWDEPGAVRYGRQEIQSMRDRLGYRLQLPQYQDLVDEFPHTTTDRLRELLSNQKHLEAKQAYDTLPDLPGEAVDAMKAYTEMTKKVTGKLPVFYLISEKKKQQEVARKRDPILLAQSPFGFFWQILGAWDDEVKFLEEL